MTDLKILSLRKLGVIIPVLMFTLVVFQIPILHSNIDDDTVVVPEGSGDKEQLLPTSNIILTSKITSSSTKSQTDSLEKDFTTRTVTPTVINRGDSFTVTGRLEDGETGQGIPDQTIKIFWQYFSWTDYENDRTNLENNYLLRTGSTDSNGDFSITTSDSDHSKAAGSINVYAVFPGNPLLGPIEDNRQYTVDVVDCYAYSILSFIADPTTVRDNSTFDVYAGLLFDNSTELSPQPVTDAEGTNISISWLGTVYNVTIIASIAFITLDVPNGTAVGTYPLELYYDISPLSLSYVRGSTQGVPNTSTWSNASRTIEIFTGAGVVFNIDEPVAPGPGENPNVLRGETYINITGQVTDDDGLPFGYPITLMVQMDGGSTITSPVSNNTGHFAASFQITSGSVGNHTLTVDVDQVVHPSITDTTVESELITIIGNSTLVSINADISRALPGENLTITGTARDLYSSVGIVDLEITAQWEDFGPIVFTNTTSGGSFSLQYTVPATVNPALQNGTIYLGTSSTQYYTASNGSYLVDVFNEANFRVWLNNTEIIDGSNISTIGGNEIYNYSTLTLKFTLRDEYDRNLGNRDVNATIGINNATIATDADGNYTNTITSVLYFAEGNYSISLIFNDNPLYEFNFGMEVLEPDLVPTQTPTGSTTPTTPGGQPLSTQLVIGLTISVVSLIIIISVIYAFGRFRKAKKGPIDLSADGMDLPTIMKMIDEAESAKDYRRATVLCYRAFEMICIQDLRIIHAKSQSPRELARLVASTNRIPVRDVTMLVMRFEEARYSNHKINKSVLNHAKQALENVQLALKQESKSK